MLGDVKLKVEKIYCYLTDNKSSPRELNLFNFKAFREQVSLRFEVSASLAIAFSWLSFHFKNSKSTAGYPRKLKQILVNFL